MGRHTAPDDESVDPVVAAALARRASDPSGAHRGDDTQRIEAALGWPEEPHETGGGLGWPGDLTPEAPSGPATGSAGPDEDAAPQAPEGIRRRGWRRLFGLDRAA